MAVRPMNDVRPTRLVALPNGDLWMPPTPDVPAERADTFDAGAPATFEDAVLEMFQHQKGEAINCVWCGEQFTRKQFNELRAHCEKLHPSVLKPLKDSEVAATLMDLSNAEVIAKVELEPI